MNTENLRQLFQSGFDYKQYTNEIVHNLFGCNDVAIKPELLDTSAEGDRSHYIGRMEETEGRLLGFFYTRVAEGSDVRRKRVGLRKLIAPYLKYDVDAAIAVFDDGTHWRLSYICDMKDGATTAKRFSYILGDEKGQYKTPLERLDKIASRYGRFKLEDLKDAFSVDSLSDEFFKEYHRHYDTIIDYLVKNANLDVKDSILHDYVKKMMGRIVFLHFLQKKGWLNDDTNYLKNLFAKQETSRQADFLEQVLEPLFFGIFNTESDKRMDLFEKEGWDPELLEQWCDMPYLNGGLFERDEVDKMRITLPSRLFEGLFNFMASYNFTVDENDPDDAEIGVDPEMLGKIFESLLEDNKAKGAFYTPKEIVRYMCKESLIAHLASKLLDVADGVVRAFVESHEMQPELEPYRDILDAALRNVKICDPAIGSGAFPMGLLNELWRCREALAIREANNLQDLQDLVSAASRSKLKKEIIENNIYGVDIEKGAIDIARLRFWLSIVVDAEEPEPLPNFDYKFMQGNSLIESYKGIDLSRISNRLRGGQSKSTQLLLGLDSDFSKKNLQRLMRDYFSVTDHKQKASMRQAINDEVKRLITDFIGGSAADLDNLDPSANQDFFLWHTWFKDIFDNGGFDIVIGNPPYVNIANIESDEYRQLLKDAFTITRNKTDLYAYFIQRAFSLMSSNGKLSYIVPETWKATDSFIKLRELLVFHHQIDRIVNLKMGVFEAIVRPMILFISNLYKEDYKINVYDSLEAYKYSIDISEIRNNPTFSIDTESSIEDKCLFKKIESVKLRLKDIVKFSRGIKTSDDKRFIHSQAPNNEYKKVFRGKNIKAYSLNWGGEYVWYRPDLMKEKVGCLPHTKEFFEVPEKIVTQRVNSSMQLLVAYDDSQNYFLDTTNVSNYNSINKVFSLKFICGVLNSKLVNYWYAKKYRMPTISGYELDTIPIPNVSKAEQKPIIELVDKIIQSKKTSSSVDTSKLEFDIDKKVYELYGLTEEEIAVIEMNI